jgi:hypothetical protein
MQRFCVSFYNEIADSYGRDHHVCQRKIVVASAKDREEALVLAIREFERAEGVANWRARATSATLDAI